MRADYRGPVAESCVEFATLERAAYNLLNNTLVRATRGRVRMSVFGVPAASPGDVRFVVANPLRPAQRRVLVAHSPDDHDALLLGGFTTSGPRLGLRICADLMARVYGLPSAARAVETGCVGAHLVGDWFVAWLHWPVAAREGGHFVRAR